MSKVTKQYELMPLEYQNQKSFYHKAVVQERDNGTEVLFSYSTPIVVRRNGKVERLWHGYSATTQKHVRAFCGLNKAEYEALPYAKEAWT